MTQIKNFKDFLNDLETKQAQLLSEKEDEIKDDKSEEKDDGSQPELDFDAQDDEEIDDGDKSDKKEDKKPSVKKITDKEIEVTSDGTWYNRTAFNFDLKSSDPKEQFKELQDKYDIVNATFNDMKNQYANSTGYKEPIKQILSGEDVVHPVKLLNSSLEEISQTFTEFWNNDFPKLLDKYENNTAKIKGSKYITGRKGTEKAIDAEKRLETQGVDFSSVEVMAEGLFKNIREKMSNNNAGGVFKSTNDLVTGSGNKYTPDKILDLTKSGTLFKKDSNVFKINEKLLLDIKTSYLNQGLNILRRYENTFNSYMNKAKKTMDQWSYALSLKHRAIKVDDTTYINSINSSLRSAFVECSNAARGLNTQLNMYGQTMSAIRKQVIFLTGVAEKEANSFKVETKLAKKQNIESHIDSAKETVADTFSTLKSKMQRQQDAADAANEHYKTTKKEIAIQNKAEEIRDSEQALLNRKDYIHDCSQALKAFPTLNSVINAAIKIRDGKAIPEFAKTTVPDGIDKDVYYARILSALNNLRSKREKRVEYLTLTPRRKSDFFGKRWDEFKNVMRDDTSKTTRDVMAKDIVNKIIPKDYESNKADDEEIRKNIEDLAAGNNNVEKKVVGKPAKSFDNEPKSIYDYAIQKAQKNNEN